MTDLIGQIVGRLKVVKFIGIKKVQQKDRLRCKYMYECLCECGNTSTVNRAHLKSKSTLSCGCLQKEKSLLGHEKQKGKPRPHMQKPDGKSVLHASFLAYKSGARRRSISFEISEIEFSNLTSQNCKYCGVEPRDLKSKKDSFATRKMNGIDRVDSNIGYTLVNIVPCCKICNYMKQELSEEEFYLHIEKILSLKGMKKQ